MGSRPSIRWSVRDPAATEPPAPPSDYNRYRMNGVDQYIQIPPVDFSSSDSMTITFEAPTFNPGVVQYLVDGDGTGTSLYIRKSTVGAVEYSPGMFVIDNGLLLHSGSSQFPIDGQVHTFQVTIQSDLRLSTLGADSLGTQCIPIALEDVTIKCASSGDRKYPLDDGWLVNPLIADRDGSKHGTAINFTETGWEI